ncbi:hypothetical protein BC830DRAFT_1230837 [Chytriomyces sp. MP71]|nr:hypothetical protein BC830DRAFT_1230837 [Chytriomyces sp. MP71]
MPAKAECTKKACCPRTPIRAQTLEVNARSGTPPVYNLVSEEDHNACSKRIAKTTITLAGSKTMQTFGFSGSGGHRSGDMVLTTNLEPTYDASLHFHATMFVSRKTQVSHLQKSVAPESASAYCSANAFIPDFGQGSSVPVCRPFRYKQQLHAWKANGLLGSALGAS